MVSSLRALVASDERNSIDTRQQRSKAGASCPRLADIGINDVLLRYKQDTGGCVGKDLLLGCMMRTWHKYNLNGADIIYRQRNNTGISRSATNRAKIVIFFQCKTFGCDSGPTVILGHARIARSSRTVSAF